MFIVNILCFIIFLVFIETAFAASGLFSFEVVIQKPDSSYLQDPNVDFKFTITDDSGACVIYSEDHNGVDMSGTNGQKTFQLGNTLLQTYPNPMVTTLTIDQVFSSSGVVYNCQGGGTYTSTSSASRKVVMEFNDGSGLQTLPAMAINSVPYAVEAQKVVSNSITTQNILDGTITAADLSSMGAATGQVMKWNGSAWVASNDLTGTNLVTSVAGRTGAVVLSSSDISGLGSLAGKNQIQLSTDVTGTLPLSNIAQSSATTGQVIKWNGSAWVVSNDDSGTNLVTSVAGRTGAVTLSSADISGIGFGTAAGTFAQGNDARFTDERNPINNSVTSAKIADGTIQSADLSAGSVTLDKLNQSAATTGQVIKWNGSAWVVSDDASGGGGSVTNVTASGPLSSTGGTTPNITIAQASGTTSGYLSSTDFSTFAAKLSDFSSLTSADITGKLGYTPVNPATAVISVAGRTGAVTLSSSDVSGLGTLAGKNQVNLSTDVTGALPLSNIAQSSATTGQVIKWNGSAWVASSDSGLTNFTSMTSDDVTTALAYTPLSPSTSFSGDISGVYNNITVNRIKNIPVTLSSITSGDIVQYNGTAFVNRNIPTCAANQYLTFNGTNYTCVTDVGASGTVGSLNSLTGALNIVTGASGSDFNINSASTTITLNMPTASSTNRGLLSSSDWSLFNAKLSDFTTLTSADITGKLGYTPVNPATAVISVAGRTGVVTLSSSDISGLGTLAGKNQVNLSTDVTGTLPLSNIAQSAATTGQVIKWNGSAWVVSDDSSGAGTVTSVTASGPLSSTGGATPNITIARATAGVDGYLSSTDFSTFAAKLSDFSTLTSADITGKLGYTPLANFTSMVSGDVTTALGYVPANVGSVILASQMPANCNAGQTLTFSSPTGAWVCSSIVLANNSVTSSMISSLDWSKVVNTPSNLAGYGVTITSADITSSLTYTPVNRAGDTMVGALNLPSNGLVVGTNQLVANSGRVGIGTASPSQALDVSGVGLFTVGTTGGGFDPVLIAKGPGGQLQFGSHGSVAKIYPTNAAGNDAATLYFEGPGAGGTIPKIYMNTSSFTVGTPSGSSARMTVSSSTDTSASVSANFVNSSGTSLLYVRGDGNLGVGTMSPGSALTVVNDAGADTKDDVQIISYGAGTLPVFSSIKARGTATVPASVAATDILGALSFAGFNGTGVDQGAIISSVAENIFSTSPDANLVFSTNNGSGVAERVRISASGRLGVGLSNPGYAVDVSGDVNVNGNFRVNGSILVTGSGTVASGTTNKLAYYTGATTVGSNTNMSVSSGALTLGTAGSALGSLAVTGNTSGTVTIQPQAAAGTYNFNLPTTAGTSGQVLTSGGGVGAPMTWLTLANSASVDATNATNITSGTLPAGRLPAFTGDVTTSAGSSATTIANNAVTSAKIADGTIVSADISSAAITFDKLNQSSATTGQVIKWNGSSWIASSEGSGPQWSATGSDIYYSAGKVGVGVATPLDSLHVNAGQMRLTNTATGTTGTGSYGAVNYNTTTGIFDIISNSSTGATIIKFFTSNTGAATEKMRIDNLGNVGIGTSGNAASKLQVNGQITNVVSSFTGAFTCGTSGIDFSTGNFQRLSSSNTIAAGSCNVVLSNLVAGGSYTLVVTGNSAVNAITYNFTGYTFKYLPTNAATTAAKDTIYTFLYDGTTVYVTWSGGY